MHKTKEEFTTTQWNNKQHHRRCKKCINNNCRSILTGELFGLMSMPADARRHVAEFCVGDGGPCSFILGVLAATEGAAEITGENVNALLRSEQYRLMFQQYHKNIVKDATVQGATQEMKEVIEEKNKTIEKLSSQLNSLTEELKHLRIKVEESADREIMWRKDAHKLSCKLERSRRKMYRAKDEVRTRDLIIDKILREGTFTDLPMHSLALGIGGDALLHILARGIGMIPDDMEIVD